MTYASGTTPLSTDPNWKRWAKMLTVMQEKPGALAKNNLNPSDPVRVIKVKILNSINGT